MRIINQSEELERLRNDFVIQRIIRQMPVDVAESFTSKQLTALKKALGTKRKHRVDLRGTLRFWRKRYYYVIIAGMDLQPLSPISNLLSRKALTFIVALGILILSLVGLVVLYIIKSALGINLLPGISLGLWDWIRNTL